MEQTPWCPDLMDPMEGTSNQSYMDTSGSSLTASGDPNKIFKRDFIFVELIDGELMVSHWLSVYFTESEACVDTITRKVKDTLRQDGKIILTDERGRKIFDCPQTREAAYWQHLRKLVAVYEDHRSFQIYRRTLERSMAQVTAQMKMVVEAAEGLNDVAALIKDVCENGNVLSTRRNAPILSEDEMETLEDTFRCLFCHNFLNGPMFATCCKCLVGCNSCVTRWLETWSHCPKCRACHMNSKVYPVAGVSEGLELLYKLLENR